MTAADPAASADPAAAADPAASADPLSGVDPVAYRQAVGRFATGILVASTQFDGIPHIMTVNAFTSVSLEPLRVLFCAEKIARFHDAVLATGTWAVSVLDESSEKLSRWLATRGRPLEGQLDGVPYHPGPVTGAPILDGSLSALECRMTAVHDGGDHSIVVGEVLAATTFRPHDQPLVFFGGRYRRLAPDPAADPAGPDDPAPPESAAT
ncbi:MAG TPA: flavin reductase family protein [Streptosporangiaceae bacterium]|jgi:flavin reductase (DIM6/NTAB) family NADH-FMN oxidoreductase RutF